MRENLRFTVDLTRRILWKILQTPLCTCVPRGQVDLTAEATILLMERLGSLEHEGQRLRLTDVHWFICPIEWVSGPGLGNLVIVVYQFRLSLNIIVYPGGGGHHARLWWLMLLLLDIYNLWAESILVWASNQRQIQQGRSLLSLGNGYRIGGIFLICQVVCGSADMMAVAAWF